MSDFQRKRLLAAESAVWFREELNTSLTEEQVEELVDEVVTTRDSGLVTVEFEPSARNIALTGNHLVVPPWARHPIAIIHALSHRLTAPEFPLHGAEFGERLIEMLHTFGSPALAAAVKSEFDERHVHYDAATRRQRVRRAAVFAANNERGVLAELILDDPPELVFGPIVALRGDVLEIGDLQVMLERGRYINFIR